MALFELIKRCLDSGYELKIYTEFNRIRIEVTAKDSEYKDRTGGWKHQCEQLIDKNNNHLFELNSRLLYCINKVDELVAQHRKLLK